MRRPSGRTPEALISATRVSIARTTSRPLAPRSIMATPPTTSPRPSLTAPPWRTACPDLGHIADEDGGPPFRFQGHLGDVVDGLEEADATDEILLLAPFEDVA